MEASEWDQRYATAEYTCRTEPNGTLPAKAIPCW